MGIDIRLPNITATDTEGKMSQMQSYMHQLVEQLNWALATVDNAIQGNTSNVVVTTQNASNGEEEAVDTFNSIKALIIKSADIVHAYEESMKTEYNGNYVAVSDFGTYLAETNHTIEENSTATTERFSKVESITTELEKVVNETETYIKRGELGVYKDGDLQGQTANGIAIGETVTNGDGHPEFKGLAWFTAGRLSFLNEGGYEVAYIGSSGNSGSKLYINTAHFLRNVQVGKYIMDTSDGIAFLWGG